MKANIFKQKVKKQLWFLNKKEKSKLDSVLESVVEKHDNEHLNRPIAFSNQFLKEYVFKEKVVSSTQLFALLLGILFTYIMLLGIFLFVFQFNCCTIFYKTRSTVIDTDSHINIYWSIITCYC